MDLSLYRCAAGAAYSGAVRDLVYRLKFSRDRGAAYPLGRLALLGARQALSGKRPDMITAVPLHPWRRLIRGYNQAELIARNVAAEMRSPFHGGLVKRVRYTAAQGRVGSGARRSNLLGAFRPTRKLRRRVLSRRAEGLHILLVDDVVSTLSTLDLCASALLDGGASRVTGAAAAT